MLKMNQCQHPRKINNFNLVEIIIAMGIIIVCLTTVIGLFSAGMKISKDATQKAYANIIIEQIVGMYDTNPDIRVKIQETANILTNATILDDKAYFTNPSDPLDAGKIFKPSSFTSTSPTAGAIKTAEENWKTDPISGVDNTINVYQSTGCDGLFKVDFQSKLDDTVDATTNTTVATVKDFSLIARVWIETIPVNAADNIPVTSFNDLQFTQRLKIELSWPPKEPYMNRLLQGNVIYFEKEL